MSARPNELRRNNASGVPCLRLRTRTTRTGLTRRWIDVSWHVGQRGGTSFPADLAPVKAVARAMKRREDVTGVTYDIGPRKAWERLKAAAR